jgi:hypothetical protein
MTTANKDQSDDLKHLYQYLLDSDCLKKKKDLEGIVQRDLTGVETRLKRSVLMNYIDTKFAFLILKEHHHERSITLVSAS